MRTSVVTCRMAGTKSSELSRCSCSKSSSHTVLERWLERQQPGAEQFGTGAPVHGRLTETTCGAWASVRRSAVVEKVRLLRARP